MKTLGARPILAALVAGMVIPSCTESQTPPSAPVPFTVGSVSGPLVAYLGEEACFEIAHTGGAGALVAWNWGDGSSDPAGAGADRACHIYQKPGKRLVAASVEAEGRKIPASRGVTVTPKPMEMRPTASSSILFDAARARVWVVNPDAGSVAVLEADPPALMKEIPLCKGPRSLALDGTTIAVACQDDGAVGLVNAESLEVTGLIDLGGGSAPFGVTADPRGGGIFVTLGGSGEVASIRTADSALLSKIPVGYDVRAIAAIADGSLLVTKWRATDSGASVFVIDARNPAALKLSKTLLLPPDVGLDSDTNNSGVPSFLGQIVPSPDGGRAIAPALQANVITGTFRTGDPLSFQTTARAILTDIELAGPLGEPLERAGGRYAFDDLDYASAVVFSPDGSLIYTAIQGAERIEVRDAFSFDVAGSIDDVGFAPQGVALSPDGERLYIQAFLSRSVRVYDVTDLSSPPEPLADVPTITEEPLAPDVLLGKQIFYRSRDPRMSRTSYLSCASCHMDGEGDNLVWDFTQRGEGLRNTIPLTGRAGAAHGPMHWSSNFDEVQDFEHDIRGPMGGLGFLPDSIFHTGSADTSLGDPKAGLSPELDALAAYVASLASFGISPHRSQDPAFLASRAKGADIFYSPEAGCATCHAGPRFTDSAFGAGGEPVLHDVGTLGPGSGMRLGGPLPGIDTPTLRGLWSSAPYLHDGSAPSLRAVLRDRNMGDKHGKTSHLSDADLADLEVFLRTLDDAEP
jgi:cytochrome c peroxidase